MSKKRDTAMMRLEQLAAARTSSTPIDYEDPAIKAAIFEHYSIDPASSGGQALIAAYKKLNHDPRNAEDRSKLTVDLAKAFFEKAKRSYKIDHAVYQQLYYDQIEVRATDLKKQWDDTKIANKLIGEAPWRDTYGNYAHDHMRRLIKNCRRKVVEPMFDSFEMPQIRNSYIREGRRWSQTVEKRERKKRIDHHWEFIARMHRAIERQASLGTGTRDLGPDLVVRQGGKVAVVEAKARPVKPRNKLKRFPKH